MKEKELFIMEFTGVQCDNPECDYKDQTIPKEEMEDWLNKPCPKCGENLLTEDDYNRFNDVVLLVETINKIGKMLGMTADDSKRCPMIHINTHKKLSITDIK